METAIDEDNNILTFHFLLRYSWFTISYKFPVYNVVMHNLWLYSICSYKIPVMFPVLFNIP